MITAFVWRQVRRSRRPRLLVVDEAWSLLQYPEGGRFLAGMARRARKYWLGLVTLSQQIADFLGAEHGRTVLANAAVKLLMKQDAASAGLVAEALHLSVDERQLLLSAGKGEGLLLARGDRIALRVEASPLEHRLATTAPQERAAAEIASAGAAEARRLGGAGGPKVGRVERVDAPRRRLAPLSGGASAGATAGKTGPASAPGEGVPQWP
jgi:hypothetical protein